MSEPTSGSRQSGALHSTVGAWIGVGSAVLTAALTAVNGWWSHQINETDQRLKQAAAQIEQDRLSLERDRERMTRYEFVQRLFPSILNDEDPGQRTLTINLINLALTPDEAQTLFAGLQASSDQRAQEAGSIGQEIVARTALVSQMNAAARDARRGAVQTLITSYAHDQGAVEQAISMLEPPNLERLSPSGRINVLVFLKEADSSAWTPALMRRAEQALRLMQRRHAEGVALIGAQTQQEMTALQERLDTLR